MQHAAVFQSVFGTSQLNLQTFEAFQMLVNSLTYPTTLPTGAALFVMSDNRFFMSLGRWIQVYK